MQLTITFTSDWHVGSGAGIPGSVDRSVLKDPDGLPFIPGKTLTGILRDAAEFVAAHLGTGWQDVVASLFGQQPESHGGTKEMESRPAKLCIGPAQLPAAVRKQIVGDAHAGQRAALFFVQPGVSIDRATGRAEDKKLFFTEKVRGGVTLAADFSLREDAPELTDHETALLVAAAAAVRRLGGGRRRGGGACTVKLTGLPNPKDLAWLKQHYAKPEAQPVSRRIADNTATTAATTKAGETWVRYRLTLTAQQPLIVARALKGNVLESLRRVPGSLLLPEVAKKLSAAPGNTNLFDAIAQGDVVVTDLLPKLEGCPTSHPAPACFSKEKENEGRCNNYRDKPKEDVQYKPVRDGWLGQATTNAPWRYYDGKDLITQRMHNTVQDQEQRPTEEVGGIYTYEAIAAGTVLVGELRLRESLKPSADGWYTKLAGNITVGRSRKDDYGAATLNVEPISDAEPVPDPCLQVTNDSGDNKVSFVLWLQSPLLVRNEQTLQHHGNPEDLAGLLQMKLGLAAPPKLTKAWGRVERIESWHGPSNRPRSSLLALAPGSVYVFEVEATQPIDADKLKSLQAGGLGERRAEGFGQVLINHPLVMDPYDETKPWRKGKRTCSTAPSNDALTTNDKQLLRRLDLWYWQEEIRRVARLHAYTTPLIPRDTKKPSRSQMGALRAAAGQMLPSLMVDGIPCYAEADLLPLKLWSAIDGNPNETLREKRVERLKERWDKHYAVVIGLLNATKDVSESLTLSMTPLDPTAWQGAWPANCAGIKDVLRPYAVKTLLEQLAEAHFDTKEN